MFLNPLSFNALLHHVGQRLTWRRAFACPCINPHSGAADVNCPHCSGKGRLWSAPVSSISGIAGAKVQREWAQFGNWESGDVVLSLPSDTPAYDMGSFDRVLLTDSSSPFSMVIKPGAALPYPGATIDRVFWIDPATREIVDGGIPIVGADGAMTWASGAPPAGMFFTVTGRRHPEYFCWGEYPQDRSHHSGARLPRRVVLRRFDLYGR